MVAACLSEVKGRFSSFGEFFDVIARPSRSVSVEIWKIVWGRHFLLVGTSSFSKLMCWCVVLCGCAL